MKHIIVPCYTIQGFDKLPNSEARNRALGITVSQLQAILAERHKVELSGEAFQQKVDKVLGLLFLQDGSQLPEVALEPAKNAE